MLQDFEVIMKKLGDDALGFSKAVPWWHQRVTLMSLDFLIEGHGSRKLSLGWELG